VNGSGGSPVAGTSTGKKWSGVVNGGASTPSTAGKRTPKERASMASKDSKVAYILLYQQIKA
jgi:hypothetical protein